MNKHGIQGSHVSITHLTIYFTRKSNKMYYWYSNTIIKQYVCTLVKLCRNRYNVILKISKLQVRILPDSLPACLPAVRPTCIRSMVPDFHMTKLILTYIVSNLQNCCFYEISFIMPWCFFHQPSQSSFSYCNL